MQAKATVSLVGAAGGVGTTRLAVESGATLARAGYDVVVLDAAFATQGLADYVAGCIETDLTGLLVDDLALSAALYPRGDCPGELSLCPVRAPFERVARAKTAGAAERFESLVGEAALSHDVVLVDTPPVAANQAVAAVSACEQVAVVTADTERGADALARVSGRLADVGAGVDAVVANFAGDERVVEEAAVGVPRGDVTGPADCPTCTGPGTPLGPPVASFLETVIDVDLDLDFEEPGRFERVLEPFE